MSIKGNAESNVLRGRISDPDKIHGLSAYELDVMAGYDGTLEEWLKYVRGDFDERVEEAKAEFNAEVDNVIVPRAKGELSEATYHAVERGSRELTRYTDEQKEVLENAAAVLDEKEVLLWKNPNTSEAFPSGTISIDYTSIEGIRDREDIDSLRIVFFTRTIGNIVLPSVQVKFGQSGRIHYDEGFTGDDGKRHSRSYLRDFLVQITGNIQFEGADPDNNVCIPYKIYGVKNSEINVAETVKDICDNTYANALVGSSTIYGGDAILLDDVSPLVKVKVDMSNAADGDTATVKSCGKNLLHTNSFTAEAFRDLNSKNATFSLFEGSVNGTFTLGFTDNLGGTSKQGFIVYVVDGTHNSRGKGWGTKFTFSGNLTSVYLTGLSNPPSGSLDNIQLEVGTEKTPFEPYKQGEEITITGGQIVELDPVSPNMTIYHDYTNIHTDITYNKDTNTVIEKLTQAIISLGGNI